MQRAASCRGESVLCGKLWFSFPGTLLGWAHPWTVCGTGMAAPCTSDAAPWAGRGDCGLKMCISESMLDAPPWKGPDHWVDSCVGLWTRKCLCGEAWKGRRRRIQRIFMNTFSREGVGKRGGIVVLNSGKEGWQIMWEKEESFLWGADLHVVSKSKHAETWALKIKKCWVILFVFYYWLLRLHLQNFLCHRWR